MWQFIKLLLATWFKRVLKLQDRELAVRTLTVSISDKLGRMDTALREKGGKEVLYRNLVRRPDQSWQPMGTYRFDHSQGHIIQIVDELAAAIEITHGLM